jgi:hypothetical protein
MRTGRSNVPDLVVVARCLHCNGPSTKPLPRFEHDGKVDFFHDCCVGVWLMKNPESVINFYTGPEWPGEATTA